MATAPNGRTEENYWEQPKQTNKEGRGGVSEHSFSGVGSQLNSDCHLEDHEPAAGARSGVRNHEATHPNDVALSNHARHHLQRDDMSRNRERRGDNAWLTTRDGVVEGLEMWLLMSQ